MAKQDDYMRYTIRVPQELYDHMQTAANNSGRSINAEIIARLEDSLNKPRKRPDFTVILEALPPGSDPQEVSLGLFLDSFSQALHNSVSPQRPTRKNKPDKNPDRTLLPPAEIVGKPNDK